MTSLMSLSNNMFKKDFASHFTKIVGGGFHAVSRLVMGYLYCHIDFLSHQIIQNPQANGGAAHQVESYNG